MKICVYGAGAIGGLMAAWLSRAGHDVSVVARGATGVPAEGVSVTPGFILKLLLPRYTTPLFSPPSTGSDTSSPPFCSAFSVVLLGFRLRH